MGRIAMIALLLASVIPAGVAPAAAQTTTCKATATDKKLAGAALNSFMKKCEKDSQATCDTNATAKKLSGAARTSFTKKCVNDAVGT